MKKYSIVAVALATLLAAGMSSMTAVEIQDNKSRIKYLEVVGTEEIGDTVRVPMGDVDEVGICISLKYTMLRPRNTNGAKYIMLNVGNDPNFSKRVDIRFVYADEDEILPPTLTKVDAVGLNEFQLTWKPVTDAVGYEVRYAKLRGGSETGVNWNSVQEQEYDGSFIINADNNNVLVDNLHYGAEYCFAIRTLGSDGKVSKWVQRSPASVFTENTDLKVPTADRAMPKVIKSISNRTEDGFRLNFDLTYDRESYPSACADMIDKNYVIKDGKFVADKIYLNNIDTRTKTYVGLTDKMLTDGYVDITGLENGAKYEVALMNSAVSKEADAMYEIANVTVNNLMTFADFVESLGTNYSQFKKWYDSHKKPKFSSEKSYVVGSEFVGLKGISYYKAIYDSVFTSANPVIGKSAFNPESPGQQFTLLLPSDEVIENAVKDAKERLAKWNLDKDEDLIRQWALEVSFFDRIISKDELSGNQTLDFYSVLGRQYRTSSQKLSSEPISVTNGVVYPISNLHIPDNFLIYRLKDWFHHYSNCSDVLKAEAFKMSNMQFNNVYVAVAGWTPLPGVWPEHEDKVLLLSPQYGGEYNPFCLDFSPVKEISVDGVSQIVPFLIPPGSYRLAFGSKQNQQMYINVSVYVGGECVAETPESIYLGSDLQYHYDRGATLPDRYPEGYDVDEVRSEGGSSKAGNYDTDGGLLIQKVVIPDLYGDGSPVPVTIRFEGSDWNGQSSLTLCHWCLRPTVDSY